MNALTPDEELENQKQPVLPGFEYVQHQYLIMRNGIEAAVHTSRMTPDEKIERGRQIQKDGHTKIKHGQELERLGFKEKMEENASLFASGKKKRMKKRSEVRRPHAVADRTRPVR